MLSVAPSASRILLVDDDRAGRRMVAKALGKQGYRITAVGTFEAREQDRFFHLLLADINLPYGSGRDLSCELRQKDPELSVVLCYGRLPT